MKKIYELIYINNHLLGCFDNKKIKMYDKNEMNELKNNLKDLIIKKEKNRHLFSLIIGLTLLLVAILLAILNLLKVININWFIYTFIIVGLVLIWVILFYVFGFFFYSKIKMNFSFYKNNTPMMYASSSYSKWLKNYKEYFLNNQFSYDKNGKQINMYFSLKMPSFRKNLIYNGYIYSNIPYFYLSIDNKKLIFLPGFVIIFNNNNIDIAFNYEISCTKKDNTYSIIYNNEEILSFVSNIIFDVNFFYFKY